MNHSRKAIHYLIATLLLIQALISAFPTNPAGAKTLPTNSNASENNRSENAVSVIAPVDNSNENEIVPVMIEKSPFSNIVQAEPDPVSDEAVLPPGTIKANATSSSYTIYLPYASSPGVPELTLAPDIWMEQTQNWLPYEIDKYAIRYPETLSNSDNLLGMNFDGVNLSGGEHTIQFFIEHRNPAANYQNATTSHPAIQGYQQNGLSVTEVEVKGVPAWAVGTVSRPVDGLCREVLVDFPDAWVHFQQLVPNNSETCPDDNVFDLVLSSFQIHVGDETSNSPQEEDAHYEDALVPTNAPNGINWVNYNRTAAYNYAATWWSPNNNDDGYYVWCSGGIACDGAHYLAHFMQAGGLNIHWNAGQNHSDSRVINTNSQRNYVVGLSDVGTTSAGNLEVGDVIYINNYTSYCWGEAVVRMSGSTPYVSTHSVNTWDVRYDLYYCGTSHWYEFVHIDSNEDHYIPQLSGNLNLSPSTQVINQPVSASFAVRNYGGQSVALSLRVTTNGGGDFATVNRTLAGGANYTYNQSRSFSSTWSRNTCAQMKIGSGSWQNIPANGYANCRTLNIVEPADVRLTNSLTLDPTELDHHGGSVQAQFSVRNFGGVGTTERFRAFVTGGTPGFPTTGDVALNPNATYAYNQSTNFSQPGIYEVTAEHRVSGVWTPLIGNGSAVVRVLAPPPPEEDQHKGNRDGDGHAGEPVNTATGNYFYGFTDMGEPTPGLMLDATRWYNALDADVVQGPFGYGTSWTYNMSITWRPDKSAEVQMADGQIAYYLGSVNPGDPLDMSGIYEAQQEHKGELERFADDTAVLTMPDQTRYYFDANGRLQQIVHSYPATITLYYNGSNQLTDIVHASGVTYTLTYSSDYISEITSSNGRSVIYTYTPVGNLATVTTPDGSLYTYTYDSNHRLLTGSDPNGHAFVINVYDVQGRVITQYDQTGQQSNFNYDNGGSLIQTYTDALGQTITHTYDSDYNLVSEIDALGHATVYTRNAQGAVTAMLDRNGNLWQYSYDVQGNLLTETDPLNNTWSYTYDVANNQTSQTNPLGHTWIYEYDAQNHLTRSTDPLGYTQKYGYDINGNLIWKEDETGALTQYGYNALGWQTTITNTLGQVTQMEYDSNGNQTRYVDANGNEALFVYDDANRLTTSIDPMGTVITYTYDAMGNLLMQSDGMGHLKHFTYDAYDRVTAETDFNGNTTQYGYDKLGRTIVITDALGLTTHYAYDAVSNLISSQEKDGAITTYAYDAMGNLISETDPLGRVTEYVYDAVGNQTEVRRSCDACSGGVAISTTTYDEVNRPNSETDPRGGQRQTIYDELNRVAIVREQVDATQWVSSTFSYDPSGRLIQEVNPIGAVTHYEYDALGQVITTTNALGYQTINQYDPVGNLLQVRNERGYATTYTYDANDRVTTKTDPLGHQFTNEYDAGGRLITSTDPLSQTTTYEYDAMGNQTAVTNPLGHTATTQYDVLNRPYQRTDAMGNITLTGYDDMGHVISETNALGYTRIYTYDVVGRRIAEQTPLGYVTTYSFDNNDNLISRQEPSGAIWQFVYDELGNQIEQIDPLGYSSTREYDLLNRIISETDPLGGVSTTEYDAAGNVVHQVDPRGAETFLTLDLMGHVLAETNALGFTRQYTYDGAGNQITEQDERGNVMTYLFDGLDRQIAQTDALGNARYSIYDEAGQLVQQADYKGYVTAFGYDEAGNQITVTDALNHATTTIYDPLNRPIEVINALGYTSFRGYDALGQMISETTPSGYITTYLYDADGRQIQRTNPLNDTWMMEYNVNGRLIHETDPLGRENWTAYDDNGRVVAQTDPLDRTTTMDYDPLGRLIVVTGPDGTNQRYTYDSVGNILSEQDGNGHITHYQYDLLNRMRRKIDPLGRAWLYLYDAASNQTALYTPNFDLVSRSYDPLGRLLTETQDGQLAGSYGYDANGNRTVMTDTIGITTYTYDALNQLVSSTAPTGETVQYGYDAAGNQTTLIYPDGATASQSYDADGALQQLAGTDGGITTYDNDSLGRPTLITQANGVTVETIYDAVGNTLQITQRQPDGTIFAQHDYVYDEADRRVQTIEFLTPDTFTTTYGYDLLDRLVSSVSSDGRSTTYTFDNAGNRLSQSGTRMRDDNLESYTLNYSYNPANQLEQAVDSVLGATTYVYDASGNRSGQTSPTERMTFVYDGKNHLTEAHVELWTGSAWGYKNGVYEGYVYDGDSRRVQKNSFAAGSGVLVSQKSYLYDNAAQWHVLQTSDSVNTQFLYDSYLHKLSFTQNSATAYFQNDSLGSILAATDDSGQPTAPDGLMRYDDYGQELGSDAALPTEDGYTGYEKDGYTGLNYGRNRYYEAATGFFITSDPFPANHQDIGDLHRYLYVQANPLNQVDPLGLTGESVQNSNWNPFPGSSGKGGLSTPLLPMSSQPGSPSICRSASCMSHIYQRNAVSYGTNSADCGQVCGFTYTVVSGDYLSRIAAKFNIPDWHYIWYHPSNYYKISNPNSIRPGQQFYIPCPNEYHAKLPRIPLPSPKPSPGICQATSSGMGLASVANVGCNQNPIDEHPTGCVIEYLRGPYESGNNIFANTKITCGANNFVGVASPKLVIKEDKKWWFDSTLVRTPRTALSSNWEQSINTKCGWRSKKYFIELTWKEWGLWDVAMLFVPAETLPEEIISEGVGFIMDGVSYYASDDQKVKSESIELCD